MQPPTEAAGTLITQLRHWGSIYTHWWRHGNNPVITRFPDRRRSWCSLWRLGMAWLGMHQSIRIATWFIRIYIITNYKVFKAKHHINGFSMDPRSTLHNHICLLTLKYIFITSFTVSALSQVHMPNTNIWHPPPTEKKTEKEKRKKIA